MSDNGDVETTIQAILKLLAFMIGVTLLCSGFIDFGSLESSGILEVFSIGPMAIAKVVAGVILMILAIEPAAISVMIQWMIRS